MCCEVVIRCNVKGEENWREKPLVLARNPCKLQQQSRRETRASCGLHHPDAVRCWYRGSRLVCRGWHRAPAVAALADDNLAKAQTAGLQFNRLHALIAWRRGVLHRTADAKVPELHEANARLTDLLAKG